MATKVLQILTTAQKCGRWNGLLRTQIRKVFWSRRLTVCSDTISTYYIFATYDSARGITLMRQKRLAELREI